MKKKLLNFYWITIVLVESFVAVQCLTEKRQITNLQFPQNDGSSENGAFGSTTPTPFASTTALPGQSSGFDSSTVNPFGYSNQPPSSGYYNNNVGFNTNQFPSSTPEAFPTTLSPYDGFNAGTPSYNAGQQNQPQYVPTYPNTGNTQQQEFANSQPFVRPQPIQTTTQVGGYPLQNFNPQTGFNSLQNNQPQNFGYPQYPISNQQYPVYNPQFQNVFPLRSQSNQPIRGPNNGGGQYNVNNPTVQPQSNLQSQPSVNPLYQNPAQQNPLQVTPLPYPQVTSPQPQFQPSPQPQFPPSSQPLQPQPPPSPSSPFQPQPSPSPFQPSSPPPPTQSPPIPIPQSTSPPPPPAPPVTFAPDIPSTTPALQPTETANTTPEPFVPVTSPTPTTSTSPFPPPTQPLPTALPVLPILPQYPISSYPYPSSIPFSGIPSYPRGYPVASVPFGVNSVNAYGQPVSSFGSRFNYGGQRMIPLGQPTNTFRQSFAPRIQPQNSFSGRPIMSYAGSFSPNSFVSRGNGFGTSTSFGGYRGGGYRSGGSSSGFYGNGRGNSYGFNGRRGVGTGGISRSYPNNPFLMG